ncbi:MAG: putative toxin-antitoxin system toxin component, PIN family [Oscillospiraceae bacterium]|nr:putative toxin-antitoxin system toxin component, PIN family [Oscillospiraceae bacterium]
MRIMIDTNVLISAFVLSSPHLIQMVEKITEQHTIVLSTYVIDELKRVTMRKFPKKYDLLESFIRKLPFELVYTPEKIDKTKYPEIRDLKDLPILVSALIEDVDVLISGDTDFALIGIGHPEIMTPRDFVKKYG